MGGGAEINTIVIIENTMNDEKKYSASSLA